MSYSQIFRRINRLLKSTVRDVMDNFSKEEEELHDFDEQLRGANRANTDSGSMRDSGSSTHGGRHGSQQQSSGQQKRQHKEGRRKPGERDDAHYYAVLGLTPDASIEQIKKAYRNLMGRYHPDRLSSLNPEQQAASSEKAKLINEAYHIIERRRGFK